MTDKFVNVRVKEKTLANLKAEADKRGMKIQKLADAAMVFGINELRKVKDGTIFLNEDAR